MKSKVPYIDPEGNLTQVQGGRLESTMQNIADYIVDHFPRRLNPKECSEDLRTFILYNKRSKTISTTKKSFKPGDSPISTSEQACYDLLTNHYALLLQCGFELPEWKSLEDYLIQGPSCIFFFHPGLGPLFSVIAQKIRGGRFAERAELQLEISEVDIEDLSLEGSLLIESASPLGKTDTAGFLTYGQESRCTLKNVSICNKGFHHELIQDYWRNEIKREEAVKIILHEGSEFYAEGIRLEGSHHFEVPAGHRLVLKSNRKEGWSEELTPVLKPTWYWRYEFNSDHSICLKKVMSS